MSESKAATLVSVELLKKYDRPGPRYTSYPTVPVWTDQVTGNIYREALSQAAEKKEPLALYCHIPFCRRRCYYCGCNTVVTNNRERVTEYIRTISYEIETVAGLLAGRRSVSQLHFGGGTPTYVNVDGLGQILETLEKYFDFLPGCEKSMEVDPRVTTREQIDFLAANGFNRVSLGVQDFTPEVQLASGRVQSYDVVRQLINYCRERGFRGINIDLIYGLPLQTVDSFNETLDKALSLKPDRVAVYSFAYLPKSMPHQSLIRPGDLPVTEVKYQLYASAIARFTGAGYSQIGMDHFALPEDELAVAQLDGRLNRNFMGYTVQQAPEMVGFGMSSIGYVNESFFQSHSKLDSYSAQINEQGVATYRGIQLSQDDLIRQYVITSLMCNFRLSFEQLQKRFGIAYSEYFRQEQQQLGDFVADSLLTIHDDRLEITPVGRTFVRNIAMTFDAYLAAEPWRTPTFSRTI